MSTAVPTLAASNPRYRRTPVYASLALAVAQDQEAYSTAIPFSCGSGHPNHAANAVGEVFVRSDSSATAPILYAAHTAASASAAAWFPVGGYRAAITAASADVTATSSETDFDQTLSIPANLLQAGKTLRIRAQGIATATNSTDTLAIKCYLGSTAVVTIPGVDVANNDIFYVDFEITARAAPAASASCVGAGVAGTGTPGTLTAKPTNLTATNFATNAALTVKLSATWSSNNAGNSCRLDVLSVKVA